MHATINWVLKKSMKNIAFNWQKHQKIATLCMLIACLEGEGEGIRKKGWERGWLRRGGGGSYTGIVTELAAEDLPSFKHYMRMDVNSFCCLVEVTSPSIVKRNTRMCSPISPSERLAWTLRFPWVPVSSEQNCHLIHCAWSVRGHIIWVESLVSAIPVHGRRMKSNRNQI